MKTTIDKKGNISVPNFLNLEKWPEIRKKKKIIIWEIIKLWIPLAAASYAAFVIPFKTHPEMESAHISDAILLGFILALAFVFTMWCCMEKNWLYMQGKLQEKSLGNKG